MSKIERETVQLFTGAMTLAAISMLLNPVTASGARDVLDEAAYGFASVIADLTGRERPVRPPRPRAEIIDLTGYSAYLANRAARPEGVAPALVPPRVVEGFVQHRHARRSTRPGLVSRERDYFGEDHEVDE